MASKTDYLTEDSPIDGQNWVCISFLSTIDPKQSDVKGVKIRGTYRTSEDAERRAKQLQEEDPNFHVFVGEVGKWLPVDPDVNLIEKNIYYEEQLNEIMQGYTQNLENSKKIENERKNEAKQKWAESEKLKKKDRNEQARAQCKNKHKNKKTDNNKTTHNDQTHIKESLDLSELKQTIDNETVKIKENEENIRKNELESDDIKSQLDKIKELYVKINNNNNQN